MGRSQCVRARDFSGIHGGQTHHTARYIDTYIQTFPVTWDTHHHQCGARHPNYNNNYSYNYNDIHNMLHTFNHVIVLMVALACGGFRRARFGI